MGIKENYLEVLKNVKEAAVNAGRDPKEVMLLAVSKTKPASAINEAIEAGARNFGENKAQEVIEKYPDITRTEGLTLHFIGHLQTNKVRSIVDKVDMIHSVDSERVAKEINAQCKKIDKIMDVLIEVNIGEEEQKFGISADNLEELLKNIEGLSNIRVRGLMTVPPLGIPDEETRACFSKLRQLFVDTKAKKYDNVRMDYLSMGMSGDYKIAIEEGSNIVRIGTAIFGERDYRR